MKQRVYSFDGHELHSLTVEAPGPLRWAAWTTDGASCLFAGDRGSLFEYNDGEFSALDSGTSENLRCVEFQPKGNRAYACGNGGTILRVDGRKATPIISGIRDSLRRMAWNPSGSRALVTGNNGVALVLGPRDELVRVTGAETHLRSVAWRPRDDFAVVAGNCFRDSIGGLTPSPNLFEFKGDSLEEVSDFQGSRADLTSASWRPDGSTCLLAGFDQTWHTPVLLSYSPGNLSAVEWVGQNLFPTACAWSPSGSFALLGTGPLTEIEGPASLYRYEEGTGVRKMAELDGFGVSCIAWRDDSLALIPCSRSVRAFSS